MSAIAYLMSSGRLLHKECNHQEMLKPIEERQIEFFDVIFYGTQNLKKYTNKTKCDICNQEVK